MAMMSKTPDLTGAFGDGENSSIATRTMLEDMQTMGLSSTRDFQQCDNSEMGRSLQKANWTLETNKERRLGIVALMIFLTLFVTYGAGFLVVEYVFVPKDGKPWEARQEAYPKPISIPLNPNSRIWATADTSLVSNLDDEEFKVYLGFIVWMTCVLAGLGLELQVWLFFLPEHGWSMSDEARWRMAQFVFPIMGTISLGLAVSHNFLAMIFIVLCIWKCGFPETLMYWFSALFDRELSTVSRVANLFNAVGTVAHHTAATFMLCMVLVEVLPGTRHAINPCLVLVMQHWFVLLRYVNTWLYAGIELLLEAYFEWNVLSDLQHIHTLHWTAGVSASVMLSAHWMYLIAICLEMLFPDSHHVESGAFDLEDMEFDLEEGQGKPSKFETLTREDTAVFTDDDWDDEKRNKGTTGGRAPSTKKAVPTKEKKQDYENPVQTLVERNPFGRAPMFGSAPAPTKRVENDGKLNDKILYSLAAAEKSDLNQVDPAPRSANAKKEAKKPPQGSNDYEC